MGLGCILGGLGWILGGLGWVLGGFRGGLRVDLRGVGGGGEYHNVIIRLVISLIIRWPTCDCQVGHLIFRWGT